MNGQLDIFSFFEKKELKEDLQEQKPHRVATPNHAGDIDFLGEVDEAYAASVKGRQLKFAELENMTGKMVFNSERKTAERVAVTTEETTGEIDADGYGWVQLQYSAEYHIRDNHLTRSNGSIDVFGHHETWYSTNEAAGKATAREIQGKHIADDGTIRDENGYICVASSDLAFYSIVITSVGPGKVYDTGCSHGTIDVYTAW